MNATSASISHPGPTASSAPQGLDEAAADETSQTILLIADAGADRDALHRQLQEPGHAVLLAHSGAEGLEMALKHQPDLILVDVSTPGMKGFEVLRRLNLDKRTMGIAVIALTGPDPLEEAAARALVMGAADHLGKPLNPPVVNARVAAHLRLAAYRRQIERMAQVDGLTGIANRRRFDAALAEESHRAQRSQQRLSVALVDVDFFGRYNESYGHSRGDNTLREVAQALRRGLRRPGDLAARYDGETFALILADISPANALTLARGMCHAVAALLIPHDKSSAGPHLTVSIGVATSEVGQDGEGEALMDQARERLLLAKAAGRNRAIGEPPAA